MRVLQVEGECRLRRLNLSQCPITASVLNSLMAVQSLTSLRLQEFRSVTKFIDFSMFTLPLLRRLRRLDLRGSRTLTDTGLQTFSVHRPPPSLTHLNISKCSHVTTSGLLALTILPQLCYVQLEGISAVPSMGERKAFHDARSRADFAHCALDLCLPPHASSYEAARAAGGVSALVPHNGFVSALPMPTM